MRTITLRTQITPLARVARQSRTFAVPLLVAGALVAGCGTAHAPASSGTSAAPGSSTASASASASAPSASATPVPTVTGGAVVAGEPACVGWPANAPRGTLTAFFNPVAVERCVTGFQKGPGNVEWQTATMLKATKNLTPLVDALLRPSTTHQPGAVCPYLVMLPPQVVLISSTGKQLIPRLPLSGCGLVASAVLGALARLIWQPVSIRLVAKVSGLQPSAVTSKQGSPKTIQTLPASVSG
jgi:hypothetical protein